MGCCHWKVAFVDTWEFWHCRIVFFRTVRLLVFNFLERPELVTANAVLTCRATIAAIKTGTVLAVWLKTWLSIMSHESVLKKEKCPICGHPLLINDVGAAWCTNCSWSGK